MSKKDKKDRIVKLIEAFLKDRRLSDGGGFAEVTDRDMERLEVILNKLIEAKFEPDADGDHPIEYTLVDRTKYERLHFILVPYDHKPRTPEQEEAMFETVMLNLSIAMGRADNAIKMRRFYRAEAERKKEEACDTKSRSPSKGT